MLRFLPSEVMIQSGLAIAPTFRRAIPTPVESYTMLDTWKTKVLVYIIKAVIQLQSPCCAYFQLFSHQWGRQWHPTPVLLPGKSHGRRSGGLQSMGSLRVGHDRATSLSLFTFMHWRRKWQPIPVFLPGESQGWGAWWAAVCGVTQSRTQLKRLSSSSNGHQ